MESTDYKLIKQTAETNVQPSNSGTSTDINLAGVLPPDEPLLTKVKRLKKTGRDGWNDHNNLITPIEAQERREKGLDYGVALGRGCDGWKLMAFDVERRGVLPEEAQALIDEHAPLTWDSVHSGRNRLLKVSEEAFTFLDSLKTGHNHLTDQPGDDIEIQTSGHVIAPGCEIAHKFCKGTKDDCPGTGTDTYELVAANSLAPVLTEELAREIIDVLEIEKESHPGEVEPSGKPPDYDKTDIAVAEEHLRTLQGNHGYAFADLSDRLNGGTGVKNNLRLCDGNYIDRSATDFVTVSDLYGVMRILGKESEERAKEFTYAYYSYRCEGEQFEKDGRLRKWLQMNDTYRQERLKWAMEVFDHGQFQRWLNRGNSDTGRPGTWTGDYSETTYNSVRFALKWLSGDLPVDYSAPTTDKLQDMALTFYGLDVDRDTLQEVAPPIQSPHHHSKDITPHEGCISPSDYPTKRQVVEIARRLDEGHNEDGSYGEALNRLRRDGIAVMACLKKGVDYRYYAHGLPHPENTEYIQTQGKKGNPEHRQSDTGIILDGTIIGVLLLNKLIGIKGLRL